MTIEGDDIDRLPDEVRKAAGDIARPFGLEGAFRDVALAAASRAFEPIDYTAAGTFDNVSAAYRAAWWGPCGALIGRRVGDIVLWSDGTQ